MIPLLVAIFAPLINSIQQLPLLYKIIKTKSVKDLSIHSLILILLANCLWLLHGYYIYDFSLIIASSVSLTINSFILILYLIYTIF